MIEPLIVVEGKLRLPSVRPLLDPSLNFGFEWALARGRPVQSQFEIALFAARFETAYLPAFRLSDSASRYRAASLWSVFAHGDIPRAVLDLLDSRRASAPAQAPSRAAVPAPLHGRPANRMSAGRQIATGAAICAGALLMLRLLFGSDPAKPDVTPAASANAAATSTPSVTAATPPASAPVLANVAVTEETPSAGMREPEPEPIARVPETAAPAPRNAAATQATAGVTRNDADGRLAAVESGSPTEAAPRRHRTKPTTPGRDPMIPATLYALLQHSPTLDSNVPASGARTTRGEGASTN
jgi:hypothetical protein